MRKLAVVLVVVCAAGASTVWAGATGPGTVTQEWTYVSENSAIVYWQTENPATSTVEYGPTPAYGRRTPVTGLPPREFFKGLFDRPYHTQFHRITGLEPDKTYHYRMVSTGTDGTQTRSVDKTFSTRTIPGTIHVPDDVAQGPPYVLNKARAAYVLTKDIEADGTAIRIDGSGITLDLNGHTIVYGNAVGEAYGVRTVEWNKRNIKVLNGIIRQGRANGRGCHPVRAREVYDMEVAGLEITYGGPDCHGIFWWEGRDQNVHHNVVFDTGTHITNRHSGLDAIHTGGTAYSTGPGTVPPGVLRCHTSSHNLVKRARHRGINAGADCAFNELYLDSWDTNAFGIRGGFNIHHNRIFGTGYMPEGIGSRWGETVEPKRIHHNYIEMVGRKITGRSREYGDQCHLSGIRVTPYRFRQENFDITGNTIILHGHHATKMRGIWACPTGKTKNIVFRDNFVKVIADDTCRLDVCQAVSVCGAPTPDQDPVIFQNNTFVTNICHVRLAESYGASNNAHFLGNTFVREGDRKDYWTVRIGRWVADTYGNIFRDSKFEGGAGYDRVRFEGGLVKLQGRDAQSAAVKWKAARDLTVQWTLTVKTVPGAQVTLKDAAARQVFTGTVGEDGKLDVPLAQYKHEGTGPYDKGGSTKTTYTPHTLTVTKDGRTATRQITVDRKQEVVIRP
ncbi:MAG: hypothetical protein AMS16_02490 [Planctomycetes bacterium DG_58]|nr:MAG: hypothetical protein AMS16_02490 [Planctomycetes bacterium DG_58]